MLKDFINDPSPASTTEPATFIVILLKKKEVDVLLPAE